MEPDERAILEIKLRDLTSDGFVAGWRELESALTSLVENCERRIITEDDERKTTRLKVQRREAIRLRNMPGDMARAIRAALNEDATGDPVNHYVQDLADGKNSGAILNFAGSTGVKQEAQDV